MALYAISEEGANNLRTLSNNILSGTVALNDAGTLLERQMLALGDRLGIYEDEIFELISKHKRALNDNSAEFVGLSNKILTKAEEISNLFVFNNVSKDNSVLNGQPYRAQRSQGKEIQNHFKEDRDKLWNETYMPLVHANIKSSVERLFSKYISNKKLEESLTALSFMDQSELADRYGEGFQKGTLGFNDGKNSNIAHDIKEAISESGNIPINFAFVTAVHENLHMMSANDSEGVIKRGIMVDEQDRAMNEAITEYFTYLSTGGDTPLGGLYPGTYSGYTILMKEIPKLEKAIGSDTLKQAYFHNRPDLIEAKVDERCGTGTWKRLCMDFYIVQYGECGENVGDAARRIEETFRIMNC